MTPGSTKKVVPKAVRIIIVGAVCIGGGSLSTHVVRLVGRKIDKRK